MSSDSLTVFVGGFGPFITEEEILGYFKQFGLVLNVILKMDTHKSINKGYCFIK